MKRLLNIMALTAWLALPLAPAGLSAEAPANLYPLPLTAAIIDEPPLTRADIMAYAAIMDKMLAAVVSYSDSAVPELYTAYVSAGWTENRAFFVLAKMGFIRTFDLRMSVDELLNDMARIPEDLVPLAVRPTRDELNLIKTNLQPLRAVFGKIQSLCGLL